MVDAMIRDYDISTHHDWSICRWRQPLKRETVATHKRRNWSWIQSVTASTSQRV